MKTRIIHRLHGFFKERLLNLCDLRVVSRAQPAPDRVEHDDYGGKHDDCGEAGVDKPEKLSLGFLRQRPENVRYRFKSGHERRSAYKCERQNRHPRITGFA